jgi:hypothetical protein
MNFDVSYQPGQGWTVGVESDGRGLYGRGDTISDAWNDLVEFLGFDPRNAA